MSTVSITSEVAAVDEWIRPERLSKGELADCRGEDRDRRIAARALAKELLVRALDRQVDDPWADIECRSPESGRPFLELSGAVRRAANGADWDRVHVSWSTSETIVGAAVWILDGTEPSPSEKELKRRERFD